MPTVLSIDAHDVERVAPQARQALAADRGEDRVHEAVQARHLVRGAGPPVLDDASAAGAVGVVGGRGVGEQVHVGAHDRERRPQLVGDDREQLGAGRVQLREPVELRLGLGLHPALLDDARRAARRSSTRNSISSGVEVARLASSGR